MLLLPVLRFLVLSPALYKAPLIVWVPTLVFQWPITIMSVRHPSVEECQHQYSWSVSPLIIILICMRPIAVWRPSLYEYQPFLSLTCLPIYDSRKTTITMSGWFQTLLEWYHRPVYPKTMLLLPVMGFLVWSPALYKAPLLVWVPTLVLKWPTNTMSVWNPSVYECQHQCSWSVCP